MTFRRFDPNTPLVVSGVIRLADKYCIESLREHLIQVVVSDWPTTLEEWDFFQAEIQAIKDKLVTTNRGLKTAGEGYQAYRTRMMPLAVPNHGHCFKVTKMMRWSQITNFRSNG